MQNPIPQKRNRKNTFFQIKQIPHPYRTPFLRKETEKIKTFLITKKTQSPTEYHSF
ncbi:Utp14 protein [Methanothermobacter wolfeii]|nr:Utp14 protein [Methanothermobacter wolfeii]